MATTIKKRHTCLTWIELILKTWDETQYIKIASIRDELKKRGQFYNDATIGRNLDYACKVLRLCHFESKNVVGENLYSLKPVKKVI